jgi:hypothetical protein
VAQAHGVMITMPHRRSSRHAVSTSQVPLRPAGPLLNSYPGAASDYGWQGWAAGAGSEAREKAVIAQCPDSCTIRHVSNMYS